MSYWPESDDPIADLYAEAEAGRRVSELTVDPLTELHSGRYREPWEYEYSHVGPLPPALHPRQVEARLSSARHRFLFWANQSGKSSYCATDFAEIALGRHPVYSEWFRPPVVLWASSLTWDLWETVQLPELLTWLPQDRIIDAPDPFRKSNKRIIRIRADNGSESRIEGKSAEQGRAKYQARRIHGIWFDEEHPENIWDEAFMRLVRFGGITLTSATPLKGFTWLYHRIYEPHKLGKLDTKQYFCSHAGMADNPGIPPEQVEQARENLKNNKAQLAARLFGQFAAPEGLALRFDPTDNFEDLSDDEARALVQMGSAFAGIDFGAWRFAFILRAADRDGRAHQIAEMFSQREDLTARAESIHALCQHYGCPNALRIWGDAANPQDIMELNSAFKRIGSPYRVVAVAAENKVRVAGVDRINDLLSRKALFYRRHVMAGKTWRLGYNASREGVPIEGSRLAWEINNWCYAEPTEGKAQRQDPDDNTADGADAIAADRYAIMSWWKAAKPEDTSPKSMQEARKRQAEAQHYDSDGDEKLERLSKRHELQQKQLKKLFRRMTK